MKLKVRSTSDYIAPEAGTYRAVFTDLEEHTPGMYGDRFKLTWTLTHDSDGVEIGEDEPRIISQITSQKMGRGAGLRAVIAALLGVPDLTGDEEIETEDLIGKQATLVLVEAPDKTDPSHIWINVGSVAPYKPRSRRPAPAAAAAAPAPARVRPALPSAEPAEFDEEGLPF